MHTCTHTFTHAHTQKVAELENSLGTTQEENQSLRDKLSEMEEEVGCARGDRREREKGEAALQVEVASLRDREAEHGWAAEAWRKGEEELRRKVEHLSEVGGAMTFVGVAMRWGRGADYGDGGEGVGNYV